MSRKDKKEGKYSFPANSNNPLYFGEENKLISRVSLLETQLPKQIKWLKN